MLWIRMKVFLGTINKIEKLRTALKAGALALTLPPMQGWKLHVKGRSSNEDKDYLVEEIVGLEINAMLPSTTAISHASFRKRRQVMVVRST